MGEVDVTIFALIKFPAPSSIPKRIDLTVDIEYTIRMKFFKNRFVGSIDNISDCYRS